MRTDTTHFEVKVRISFALLRSLALYVGGFYVAYCAYSNLPHDMSLSSVTLAVVQWFIAQFMAGWNLFLAACRALYFPPTPHHIMSVLVFIVIHLLCTYVILCLSARIGY